MNLHHLELFYHVARSGGISRALRHIPYGIQQPAVSIQMLALEEHLGVKLFDRQPFRLSTEGQELFEFVRPFFEQITSVEARLQRKQSPLFRIAASELVLRDYLPPVLNEVKTQHAGLRFRLRSGMQAEMEQWLQAGEIDLAITPLDSRPKANLRSRSLLSLPLVLIVPRASPIKAAAQLWAQDSLRESLITLPPGETITKLFYRGLRDLKVDWPAAIEASSMDLVAEYVANGYGIGVTAGVPRLAELPEVRVLALPGFQPVEMAALWCPPAHTLLPDVLRAIERRATALFPKQLKARRRR